MTLDDSARSCKNGTVMTVLRFETWEKRVEKIETAEFNSADTRRHSN